MWDKRYRRLELNEVIKHGDEVNCGERGTDGALLWSQPLDKNIGAKAPDPAYTSHRWYRRLKDT